MRKELLSAETLGYLPPVLIADQLGTVVSRGLRRTPGGSVIQEGLHGGNVRNITNEALGYGTVAAGAAAVGYLITRVALER